jgi:hypothetical protein
MATCTHTKKIEGKWVANPFHDPDECELDGFDSGPPEWEVGYEEQTTVDVDVHRYKCTQCGHIMYYSESARLHHEEGKPLPFGDVFTEARKEFVNNLNSKK